MDEQKVIQVLKEIFDKYGVEGLRDGKTRKMIIESYISDMLNSTEYRDENFVLTQAMKSTAIFPVMALNITADVAENAVEQLEQEARMRREDAEFIVRCIITARGGNPDIIEKANCEEQKKQPQEKKTVQSQRTKNAEQYKEIEQTQTTKYAKPYRKTNEIAQNQYQAQNRTMQRDNSQNDGQCISMIPCKLHKKWSLTRRGKLYLYGDRMIFIPSKNNKQTEIYYQDIKKTNIFLSWYLFLGVFCILEALSVVAAGGPTIIGVVFGIIIYVVASIIFILFNAKYLWITMIHPETGKKILYNFRFYGSTKKKEALSIIKKGINKI